MLDWLAGCYRCVQCHPKSAHLTWVYFTFWKFVDTELRWNESFPDEWLWICWPLPLLWFLGEMSGAGVWTGAWLLEVLGVLCFPLWCHYCFLWRQRADVQSSDGPSGLVSVWTWAQASETHVRSKLASWLSQLRLITHPPPRRCAAHHTGPACHGLPAAVPVSAGGPQPPELPAALASATWPLGAPGRWALPPLVFCSSSALCAANWKGKFSLVGHSIGRLFSFSSMVT